MMPLPNQVANTEAEQSQIGSLRPATMKSVTECVPRAGQDERFGGHMSFFLFVGQRQRIAANHGNYVWGRRPSAKCRLRHAH